LTEAAKLYSNEKIDEQYDSMAVDTPNQSLEELHQKLVNQQTEDFLNKVESKAHEQAKNTESSEPNLSAIAIKRLQRDFQRLSKIDTKQQVYYSVYLVDTDRDLLCLW
jgi:hypothetical protein